MSPATVALPFAHAVIPTILCIEMLLYIGGTAPQASTPSPQAGLLWPLCSWTWTNQCNKIITHTAADTGQAIRLAGSSKRTNKKEGRHIIFAHVSTQDWPKMQPCTLVLVNPITLIIQMCTAIRQSSFNQQLSNSQ